MNIKESKKRGTCRKAGSFFVYYSQKSSAKNIYSHESYENPLSRKSRNANITMSIGTVTGNNTDSVTEKDSGSTNTGFSFMEKERKK